MLHGAHHASGFVARALLALALLSGLALPRAAATPSWRDHLRHAETYYWLGMEENGDMAALRDASRHLAAVESALAAPDAPPDLAARRAEVASLRRTIEHQLDIAHDTFRGVFPLTRFLVGSLFTAPTLAGSYELVDEPKVVAATLAAENLGRLLASYAQRRGQIDYLVTSQPHDPAIEDEVLYVLDQVTGCLAHNAREVARALGPVDGPLPPDAARSFARATGIPAAMLVTARRVDVVPDGEGEGLHFYRVWGHLWGAEDETPSLTHSAPGFARDRRGWLWPIVGAHAALFVLALAAPWLRRRREDDVPTAPVALLMACAGGFLFGRFAPLFVAPVLATFVPRAETLAVLSFWWPALVGVVALGLLPGVYVLVLRRVGRYVDALDPTGHESPVALAAAMGAVSWMGTASLLYAGVEGLLPLGFSVLTAAVVARGVGHVIAERLSLPWAAGLLLVAAAWGATAATAVPAPLAATAIAAGALAIAWTPRLSSAAGVVRRPVSADEARRTAVSPEIATLLERIDDPPYERFQAFTDARKELGELVPGKTAWLSLVGPAGCGKTATARALIATLREESPETLVLRGQFSDRDHGTQEPYGAFRQAVGEAPFSGSLSDNLTDGILSRLGVGDAAGQRTPAEIHAAVAARLKKLALVRGRVCVFLDDTHEMDASSRELLEYLWRQLGPAGDVPIVFLLAGQRDGSYVAPIFESAVEISPLDRDEQARLLARSLSVDAESARLVVDNVPRGDDLHLLLATLRYQAERGAYEPTPDGDGYRLSPRYRGSPESLPFPRNLRRAVRSQIHGLDRTGREALLGAAVLGTDFDASTLAALLNWRRRDTLHVLASLERETGFLYDVSETDDRFAFRTSALLTLVRDELHVSGGGPSDRVPQLVRDMHASAADVYARLADTDHGALWRAAYHAYAAGTSRARDAVSLCHRASVVARRLCDFDTARKYIDRAIDVARVAELSFDGELEKALLGADKAHVRGTGTHEAASELWRLVEERQSPSAELLAAAARAHFDVSQQEGEKGSWAVERTESLGGMLQRLPGASVNARAEGLQFEGLARRNQGDLVGAEERLREAYAALRDIADQDTDAAALLSRVQDSLANVLYRRHFRLSGEEKLRVAEDCRGLFEASIEYKRNASIPDREGLARSLGGLGRLWLCGPSRDIGAAVKAFEEDLELSVELEDRIGQVMMNSHLGECAALEERWGDAIAYYEASWKLAVSDNDYFFAGSALLSLPDGDRRELPVAEIGATLARTSGAIPAPCVAKLGAALERPELAAQPWADELRARLAATTAPS